MQQSESRPFVPSSSFDLNNNDGEETLLPVKRGEGGERLRFSREQLLQLKESIEVSVELLRRSKEIAAELFGEEEQSWAGRAVESKNRYSEPENCYWHSRAPATTLGKEWSRDEAREATNASSIRSNQGSGPGNIRLIAELWKQKMVPEKIVHRIIVELLIGDIKACPAEADVEGLCQLFITIGKQLDEKPSSQRINESYFLRLKDLAMDPQLKLRLRFMVQNVIDLRANKWVPRREEVGFAMR